MFFGAARNANRCKLGDEGKDKAAVGPGLEAKQVAGPSRQGGGARMMGAQLAKCKSLPLLLLSSAWVSSSLHVSAARHASTWAAKPQASKPSVVLAKGSMDEKSRYRMETEQLSGLPDLDKPFCVLGIESSCDDTGVAVVRSDGQILSNVVISQHQIHANFGGVVPSLAMEAHKSNIDVAVERAIAEAGLKSPADVQAIAVTKGPGLEICIRVGLNKAQELASSHSLPLVTVHHLEAHCLVARLAGETISSLTPSLAHVSEATVAKIPRVAFPFLALLASGGHTSILVCRGLGQYELLGGTIDDALGEGLDKAARLLGLRYPGSGGAAVERLAQQHVQEQSVFSHSMTVPLRSRPSCDFSYSGLKNAFRLEVLRMRAALGLDLSVTNAPAGQLEETKELIALPAEATAFLCHAYQDVAFKHVEDRLRRAIPLAHSLAGEDLSSLVVVGGVAANQELRRRLLQLLDQYNQHLQSNRPGSQPMRLVFPPPALCTDNGVMVAWAGIEKLLAGISNARSGHQSVPRWPLGNPIASAAAP